MFWVIQGRNGGYVGRVGFAKEGSIRNAMRFHRKSEAEQVARKLGGLAVVADTVPAMIKPGDDLVENKNQAPIRDPGVTKQN